ncbi:hypothetical protein PybrP1_011185 [[Pythium] brassicae (nom. inval.)]|nr:hypothetical protein PybrP1_011185 [[Pythium] brassicae (nom. inval.)]
MFGFNVNKLKPNLKMAVHRIGIVKNKKANAAVAVRREIAALLADGKEEKARIRVEGIIRDDFTVEGYEILELLCELVAERANLVKTERECPYDMREAVCTLIWAANRTEIPELIEDFAAAAARNVDGCVNERVMQKLSVQPPSAFLVVNYMKEIAKQFKVEWEPDEQAVVDPLAPIPAPTGMSVASAGVSGPDYVALYTMAPPAARAQPAPPTEKPVDSSVYRVTTPSASSRLFAPPPAPPVGYHQHSSAPSVPPSPPAARQQHQHESLYQQTPPPPAPQQQQQHHHQHHQQTSPYVAPHAAVPTRAQPPAPSPAAGQSSSAATGDSSVPDFDELTARFERLRKRQDDQDSLSFTF